MTCSRLFILGALLTIAPPVTAQPAAPAPAAPTAAAPNATAQPLPGKGAPAKAKAKPAAAPAKGPAATVDAAPASPAPASPAPDGAAAVGKPAGKAKAAAKPAANPNPKAATAQPPVVKAAAPAAAPAQYPFGLPEPKVKVVRHHVELVAAERHSAKRDETIQPGHKLSTAAQSSAEVSFSDGTRLLVSENSELGLYGVAPPPLPPGKKGKAPVFKPGTTTLLHGDVLLIVPGVAPAPALAPPPVAAPAKGAKAAIAKGPKSGKGPRAAPAPKLAVTASMATPVGRIVASPGSELRISVDQTGLTRVSVYSGEARLFGKGKPVLLASGVGGSIDSVKTPPKSGLALPPAPVLANAQQLIFSHGEHVELRGSYGPAAGAPASPFWHIQVARDQAFENLLSDTRSASTETRLMAHRAEPGDYYLRASAIGADGIEGKPGLTTRIRVARVRVTPGAEGKRAAVAVEGKDLYCSLDGAPLTPAIEPLELTPARDHLLRCATVPASPRPEESAEQPVTAAQSGLLVARMEPGAVSYTVADPKTQVEATGQRQVTLVLADAIGSPLSGATVTAEATGGARVSEVRESATPGSYVASVSWPAGQTGQSLRYRINGIETYEARLPDAPPPVVEKPPVETAAGEPAGGKRVALEVGLFPTAGIDTSRLSFNVGAGIEIGTRIRLPYGAIAIALRPQYEYFPASPAVAHVVAAGLPITYRIRKNVDADIVPYIGVLPQFLAHYDFLVRDGLQVSDGSWQKAFAIGGLVGTEFRIKHGAVFVEGGYRYVVYRSVDTLDSFPTFNGAFANLGFRLTF